MPAIPLRESERERLDTSIAVDHVMSLLEPYPAVLMRASRASTLVNSVRNDGPELLDVAA
jgi:putative SOS response-associated peptidase YedK